MSEGERSSAERARTASDAFSRAFGREPAFAVRAPGRVNLIGEHTDYNDGLVLPCAIDLDTAMWVAPRDDRRVRVLSTEFREQAEFEIDAVLPPEDPTPDAAPLSYRSKNGSEGRGTSSLETGSQTGDESRSGREVSPSRRPPTTSWIDYVAGPAYALGTSGRDVSRLRGFDAVVESRVPIGAGLSSSAALGLASAWALAEANDLTLGKRELAELAWCGERDYVGLGCGVLDFYASALGRRDTALRIDCRDRSVREIVFPPEVEILIAHSGLTRSLTTSHYTERVAECARAVEQARQSGLGPSEPTTLRDFEPEDLPDLERQLDPVAFRRARHVIEENRRVDRFASAIATDRFAEAGAILREGMESLRSDYEASAPELDFLCAAGDAADGCHGSRLTGAGWGGCSIHLIEAGAGPAVAAQIEARFRKNFGRTPPTWTVRASQGAGPWLPGVSDAESHIIDLRS